MLSASLNKTFLSFFLTILCVFSREGGAYLKITCNSISLPSAPLNVLKDQCEGKITITRRPAFGHVKKLTCNFSDMKVSWQLLMSNTRDLHKCMLYRMGQSQEVV